MAFPTKFSIQSFLKQVKELKEPQRNSITQTGFGHLLHIPPHTLRRSQLLQLKETWNIERQSFIFPPGDITITLLDVVLILGLRVIGKPVVLKQDTPLTNLEQEFGASNENRFISVETLKKRLESCGERADSSFVRVFLLYCFGTLLFPSSNGKVDSRYLLLLEDLDHVSSYSWGAAVREDLHESLTLWKSKKTSNVTGCLILLQIWCYEHIVIGRAKLLDCPSTFPHILWRLQPTSEEMEIDIIKEIPQEWYLLNGPGTMEEPINIESERVNRMMQVHKEEEKQEEILEQQISTILVLSDDDESNLIRRLKEENSELKVTVEELKKDKETMKKEIEELRMLQSHLEMDKSEVITKATEQLDKFTLGSNSWTNFEVAACKAGYKDIIKKVGQQYKLQEVWNNMSKDDKKLFEAHKHTIKCKIACSIPEFQQRKKKASEEMIRKFCSDKSNKVVSMKTVKEILKDKENHDDVLRAFALLALRFIVCPPSREKLDTWTLNYVEDVNSLQMKPWATLAMQSLVKGIRTYQNQTGKSECYLGGSMVFLHVPHFDEGGVNVSNNQEATKEGIVNGLNKKFQEFASVTKKSVLLKQELVDEFDHYSEIYPDTETKEKGNECKIFDLQSFLFLKS
ncbi:hypothetical protein LXL04_019278 [Taraxacum kok-saghyz]